MEFFFPTPDGLGREPADKAEEYWQACRKGAEQDLARDALARRVYRLEFTHNGRELSAVVGKPDAFERQTVMAIIAFSGLYSIRCLVRGFLMIGEPILVSEGAVRHVEDFA
jgi:hypothetical protein